MVPMIRYIVKAVGANFLVRDTMTGETVFGSVTKYGHEATIHARRLNAAYDRFKAELPRPIVEPTDARD